MSGKTPRENKRHLNNLLSNWKVQQYFNLKKDSVRDLADAVRKGDVEKMEEILSENIIPNGEGISEILDKGYDTQIIQLSGDLIKEEMDRIEFEALKSFKELDVEKIRKQIEEIESLSDISGIKRRSSNIKKQLLDAELKLALPEEIKNIAIEILKERGKDVSSVKTAKVIQKWGRSGKRALVIWSSKGINAVEYLDKPVEKIKKQKLQYLPTQEEIPKSRKGKFFTLKERNFVKSRRRKTEEQVVDNYFKIFGKVRTRTEIKKLIKFK